MGEAFYWYKGGPTLPRKMNPQGITHKKFMVEIYRLCLKLIDFSMSFMRGCVHLKRKQQVGGQNISILHNFGSQRVDLGPDCSRKLMLFF